MKIRPILLTALTGISLTLGVSGGANASSKVNDYIKNNNIGHATVTKSIWSGFPKNKYRHGVGKPEGVVVHETGNPSSTIYGEIAYMKRNYQNAFVHSFVDASKIINIANTNYLAWGVGFPGNARFVQFEQVEVHSKSAFAKEVANAAYYTAYLLHQYNLKPNDAAYDGKGTVWSHGAVAKFLGGSDHTDPVGYYASAGKKYFGQAYTMASFYTLVKSDYNQLSGSASADQHAKPQTAVYTGMTATGQLSKSYNKYYLYTHVKGANANAARKSWTSVAAKAGKKVYVDMTAKKSNGSIWYRVRFSKSNTAKRYWVYSKVLTLPSTAAATATSSTSSNAADSSSQVGATATNSSTTATSSTLSSSN